MSGLENTVGLPMLEAPSPLHRPERWAALEAGILPPVQDPEEGEE